MTMMREEGLIEAAVKQGLDLKCPTAFIVIYRLFASQPRRSKIEALSLASKYYPHSYDLYRIAFLNHLPMPPLDPEALAMDQAHTTVINRN